MDPRGEHLRNYRYADICQKLNTLTKAVYVTQFFDALMIWLTISKYSYVIGKKVIPNLSIDKEISLWTNRVALSGIIYHEREHFRWHFTLGVKLNNIFEKQY